MQENTVITSDFKKLSADEKSRVCGHDIAQQVCSFILHTAMYLLPLSQ